MTTSVLGFYTTSIGKKAVMAVTGFLLFGFVLVPLVGSLLVYSGPAQLNAYAVFLRKVPALLWLARATLFVAVVIHALFGLQLKLQAWRSRGARYARFTPVESTLSSRNMIWTGLMVGFFVVYHLLHFTLGTVLPGFNEHDVYRNFVTGFQVVPVSVAYMAAMVLLGLHLYHGTWSMFQSVGLSQNPKYDFWRRAFATCATLGIVGANLLFPISVLAGWVK